MIKVLNKSVSELIAAGEVIERPASVVKELIENSIDAGAKAITVEIKNGGITFLRISDDGKGIPHAQCPTAFLRHATSKVSSEEDLTSISTLGFRGEALASVAAVSRVSLLTKTADCELGSSYKIEGGNEIEHSEAGCPDGTTIIIKDLFFNMPARLKFLKKDVTEGNYVQSVVDKAALVNPRISFRFIRDNNLVRVTPGGKGDGELYSAIYAIYGKSMAESMIRVDYTQNGISVSGYTSKPLFCRSNRAFQSFYVNERYIKSPTFMTATEQAYRNNIMTGKFPACVLNVKINPADVDANVHPAKTEVKFVNDRAVFSVIHIAVKNALLNESTGEAYKPSETTETPEPNQEDIEIPETLIIKSDKADYTAVVPRLQAEPQPTIPSNVEFKHINPNSFVKKEKPVPCQAVLAELEKDIDGARKVRVIGELFSTYIICEVNGRTDELILIDKHAADERLRFDKMKRELKTHSQLLIEPFEVQLDSETCERLAQCCDVLEEVGLKLRVSETVKVVAMPTILENSQIEDVLSSISFDGINLIDEVLHRIACRSAIKAGDKSMSYDMEELAQRVLSGSDLQYCPHGRPIYIKITKHELEKKFKRIV
jgi:DNA mismatch repair protein MutL